MSRHDDAGEDLLAGVDLHVWRVPPPAALHRPSLLVRALSPIAGSAKRRRVGWILAASVVLNAVLAIVILLPRPPAPQQTVMVQAPGGGPVDARVRELLQRLAQEQRELERRLVEIQELQALIVELSEKVRKYEEQDKTRDRTVDKQRERRVPDRVYREPIDPYDHANPTPPSVSCDEVSCVLSNYEGECCRKYRSRRPVVATPPNGPPDSLDRHMISQGIAGIKSKVIACGDFSAAKGKVKLRVSVEPSGKVRTIEVEVTPDPTLGSCVARAVQGAVFARTVQGGSFSYPFIF